MGNFFRSFRVRSLIALLIIAGFAWPAVDGLACTTFSFHGLMGKSYDWDQKEGVVLLNKRNVAKRSLTLKPTDRAVEWTSRFASLTFNQYGQEFPLGGINEKGLAVEIMILSSSQYPAADTRGSVNELQWIQYQLDNFETVDEAITAESQVRISKVYANVHYLVCDRTNRCATFEYIDGKAVIHSGDNLPVAALANSTYSSSLEELRRYTGYGGSLPLPLSATDSLQRFVVAGTFAQKQGKSSFESAFDILSRVRVEGLSKWNIVYDLSGSKVQFRTSDMTDIKSLNLEGLSKSCREPNLAIDIQTEASGDITSMLKKFGLSENAALVENTLAPLGLPAAVKKMAAEYPSTTRCLE